MSFKTVLVVTGKEGGDAEVDRVAAIARGLDAHLTVLVLGVAPPPPVSPYAIVAGDFWATEVRDGQVMAQERVAALAARLQAAGGSVSVLSDFVDSGSVATLAARFARYADLTVVTPQAAGAGTFQDWVINGALYESGRPVLVLPQAETAFPVVPRVMIAWDASLEASKAVRDAIGLMRAAEEVHAVLVDPVPSFDGHGSEPGSDLAAYLSRHGIQVTVHRLPKEGKDDASLLRRTATDLDAGLIVMGGFGHSRLRERIFGGTTIAMMKETVVPVLMAH